MDRVRSHTGHTAWEVMVRCASASDLSETFEKIVKNWIKDSFVITPCHLLTLYTLFVDVLIFHLQNNTSVNIPGELKRLHNILQTSLDHSVLVQVLKMIKD
nr:TPA_asm: hypothetical protein [Larimichthys croaker adintovirus]